MADLFWPGAERAGAHFDASSFLTAMVRAEEAWLGVLGRPQDLSEVLAPDDLEALALGAESGGNPVLDVAKLVRERSGESIAHRGLTSQDVLDTALMLLAKESMTALRQDLAAAVDALISLVVTHRETPMAARTLTQHAVPTTFGLRAATWLTGVLDAAEDVVALRFRCSWAALPAPWPPPWSWAWTRCSRGASSPGCWVWRPPCRGTPPGVR